MFRQKQYDQMTVSTASEASSLESVKVEEDSSAEFSTTDEERALQMKSLLDAKIEKSIRTIVQTKERRRSSIEEGSTGLQTGSNHSNNDCSFHVTSNERRKRASGLSVSEECPAVNKRKEEASGLSVSEHGAAYPVPINCKSDLDLNAFQCANSVRAADVRRRKSANDEPSAEDKRRARLFMAQNGSRRASIAASTYGEWQKGSNYRELYSERVETRPRLRKFGSRRTLSNESDSIGLHKDSCELVTLMQRNISQKMLSSGNEKSSGSNITKERLGRSISSRRLSIDSNSVALQKQSRRISSRRKLSMEREAIPAEFSVRRPSSLQLDVGRRRVASALALSELGYRDSRSKAQSVASRRREFARSRSFRLAGTQDETFDQSPPDNKNFTWTWKNDEMEPTVRRSNLCSVLSNTTPSQIKSVVSYRTLEQDFFSSSTSPSPKATGRLSMPTSSDFTRSDHPMSFLITAQRQGQKKIEPKRTSTCTDSFLSPGARRTSRAREQLVSPLERATSYPKLPLASPDSTKSNWKKSRGATLRREASKSKIVINTPKTNSLDLPRVEDVVSRKDIGAIVKVLKHSNQAEEDLLRQKQEEREAKRSHVRARRKQRIKFTS